MITEIIKPPFTEEQVIALNYYQHIDIMHDYTCRNEHGGVRKLVATKDGWICPSCDYAQETALSWMTDLEGLKRFEKDFYEKFKIAKS